jgi:hypothetical protein
MSISPSVEALARAMCAALEIDPDKVFVHGADYRTYPTINRREGAYSVPAIALHSPRWTQFAWEAHKWIFENSGGELPPRS